MNEKIKKSLDDLFTAMKTLREEGMLINKKDFTGQLGEWFVEMIYEGKRALSGIQKDWDVDVNGRHIQVKAHAKAESTTAKWSSINKNPSEKVDELIILVFSFDYKLKEFYKIPWREASLLIKLRGKKSPRYEINWSSIKNYKIQIANLPHQGIVSLFT